jgi:hypothetical protein
MSSEQKRLQLLAQFNKVRGKDQKLLAMRIRLLDWGLEKRQIKTATPSFEQMVRAELF